MEPKNQMRIWPNRAGIPLDKSTWKWHRNLEHYETKTERQRITKMVKWRKQWCKKSHQPKEQTKNLLKIKNNRKLQMWRLSPSGHQHPHRITLTKLCLSNHKLAIETGRYVWPYKKPEERICRIGKKDVEDALRIKKKEVLCMNT